ncbi:TVP38/TMEM64 family protein [Umezawaea endophytica]|uniref:TVP38/TMEM64 family membrane protein n=1 Tax=Umezawaea endophytica TaxID=1654476 RepID=A0A9X2VEI6_9PSEU|nr:VTT domain-containing protein [Umezawaea endophytica]MCS7475225.1 VTT domain-containing protein [Umezawaea endophytica]
MVLLVVGAVALAVAAVLVDLPTVDQLRAQVLGAGSLGSVAFVAFCAVGTAAFFPKPVLATVAGLLFGVVLGVALAVVGFTAGALISFGVARKLGRNAVAARLGHGRLRVLDAVFATRGVSATLVLRLVPLVPFTASNFGAGVTAVPLRSFAVGTAVGLVPSTVLAAVLGDALQDLGSPGSFVALGAWLVLSVTGLLWGRHLVASAGDGGSGKLAPSTEREEKR